MANDSKPSLMVLCKRWVASNPPPPSLETRPLPSATFSSFRTNTQRRRVWETAYTVLDPCAKILAGQSDCRTRMTSRI